MASSGNVTLSFLSDEVESQAAETTRSWVGTTIIPEGTSLTWFWILVPFAFAFTIFICFECFLLGLPCRRRRYYTRSFVPSKSNTTLSDARSTTIDDDTMTYHGHRTTTSMSSSHDIIRHTSMTDCCSICGNTASGADVLMGVSSFKRNRHRHYHYRGPDGSHRHHDHRNNLRSHHVPLKDHSSSGYVNEEDSFDFQDRSGESSAYGSQHGTHVDRYFASETSIAPRSTDFDEESHTPRYTPTVSRSISENVEVDDGYLQGEREPVTSPMKAYYPGLYKGLYIEENAGPASLSTFSDNSRLYLSQPSSDIETSVNSHLSNGRYEQSYRHPSPQHQHHHQNRPHRHHGNPSGWRIDSNTYPKRNLNDRSSSDVKYSKPPPAYVPRQVKHCYIGNPFDEISVTVTGMV